MVEITAFPASSYLLKSKQVLISRTCLRLELFNLEHSYCSARVPRERAQVSQYPRMPTRLPLTKNHNHGRTPPRRGGDFSFCWPKLIKYNSEGRPILAFQMRKKVRQTLSPPAMIQWLHDISYRSLGDRSSLRANHTPLRLSLTPGPCHSIGQLPGYTRSFEFYPTRQIPSIAVCQAKG